MSQISDSVPQALQLVDVDSAASAKLAALQVEAALQHVDSVTQALQLVDVDWVKLALQLADSVRQALQLAD